MGEARRRKQRLGDAYGTPATASVATVRRLMGLPPAPTIPKELEGADDWELAESGYNDPWAGAAECFMADMMIQKNRQDKDQGSTAAT